jgi:hypothetical protein
MFWLWIALAVLGGIGLGIIGLICWAEWMWRSSGTAEVFAGVAKVFVERLSGRRN